MWAGAILANEQNAAATTANPEPPKLPSLDPTSNVRERYNSLGTFDTLVENAAKVTKQCSDDDFERPLPIVTTIDKPSDGTVSSELSPALNKFKLIALQEGKRKVEEKRTEEITAEAIMNTFTEALRVAAEEKKALREASWYIFLPDSRIKRLWELFLVVLLGYTVSVLPIREAFDITTEVDAPLDIIVDLAFMLDVIMTFFTAIEGPNGEIISDPKEIAISYAKGWLIIDFLSSFPFSLAEHFDSCEWPN